MWEKGKKNKRLRPLILPPLDQHVVATTSGLTLSDTHSHTHNNPYITLIALNCHGFTQERGKRTSNGWAHLSWSQLRFWKTSRRFMDQCFMFFFHSTSFFFFIFLLFHLVFFFKNSQIPKKKHFLKMFAISK